MGETMSLDVEMLADQISRAFGRAGAHSIWEIVLHLAGGYTLVLGRLPGEGAQLSREEEWASDAGVQFGGLARKPASLGGTESTAASCRAAFPAERLLQQLGSEY